MTFQRDLDNVKMNRHAKYLGHRSCSSKFVGRTHRHTHTHPTLCSTWTTKLVGNINILADGISCLSLHGRCGVSAILAPLYKCQDLLTDLLTY